MKKYFILFFIFLCSGVWSFTLTEDYITVISPNAGSAEKYAAEEFVRYVKLISGISLEISENPQKDRNIFINTKSPIKDDDGINIRTKGNNLYLLGNNDRGTIYSVYEFLEKYLGCRFFLFNREYIPHKTNINIPKINYSYTPPFFSRECTFRGNMLNGSFAAKRHLNGHFNRIGEEMGGNITLIGFCHTMDKLMPDYEYGESHPEYYILTEGKRVPGGSSQLCWSNKEMQKELAKNVIKQLDKEKNPRIISVSQNDNQKVCECENCKKAFEKYGSVSGALIETVNVVADEVKKKYPNVFVETIAYHQTMLPPKNIKARDNVIVRVCDIECNVIEPISYMSKNQPYKRISHHYQNINHNTINRDFANSLIEWSKVAKNLFVWDYVVSFNQYFIAHPNFQVLAPNIRFFRDHNVKAVFEQGDGYNDQATFNDLKEYIIAKLLWDPDTDTEKDKKEFCDYVYGKGGDEVIEIIDIFCNYAYNNHLYAPCRIHDMNWLPSEEHIKCIKLFQKALKETEDSSFAND